MLYVASLDHQSTLVVYGDKNTVCEEFEEEVNAGEDGSSWVPVDSKSSLWRQYCQNFQ